MTDHAKVARIRADIQWKNARLHDAQEHSIIVRLEREIAELQGQLLKEQNR